MPETDCYENDSKGLRTLTEIHNNINGLCRSLRNVSNYRSHILEQIKKRLRITSKQEIG